MSLVCNKYSVCKGAYLDSINLHLSRRAAHPAARFSNVDTSRLDAANDPLEYLRGLFDAESATEEYLREWRERQAKRSGAANAAWVHLPNRINKQKVFKAISNRDNGHVLSYSVTGNYNRKAVVSGRRVEFSRFSYNVVTGGCHNPGGRAGKADLETDSVQNRLTVIRRAKLAVRRLIDCNVRQWGDFPPVFLTLTFKDNVQDVKQCNYEWKKFRQRLEYYVGDGWKMKYLVVVELQKRGVPHYHVVIFNLPYIDQAVLRKIWGQGGTYIEIAVSKRRPVLDASEGVVHDLSDVDDVSSYISKYMTKEAIGSDTEVSLRGQKMYFTSRGLHKPLVITEDSRLDTIEFMMSHYDGRRGYKAYQIELEWGGKIDVTECLVDSADAAALVSLGRSWLAAVGEDYYYNSLVRAFRSNAHPVTKQYDMMQGVHYDSQFAKYLYERCY